MDGTKRCRIQFGLEAGESARTIAKEIGVSLTTVTREITKHTYESFYDDVAFNLPIVAFTLSGDPRGATVQLTVLFYAGLAFGAFEQGL